MAPPLDNPDVLEVMPLVAPVMVSACVFNVITPALSEWIDPGPSAAVEIEPPLIKIPPLVAGFSAGSLISVLPDCVTVTVPASPTVWLEAEIVPPLTTFKSPVTFSSMLPPLPVLALPVQDVPVLDERIPVACDGSAPCHR